MLWGKYLVEVITTKFLPHNIREKLNRDNKKHTLFRKKSTIDFLSMSQLKE